MARISAALRGGKSGQFQRQFPQAGAYRGGNRGTVVLNGGSGGGSPKSGPGLNFNGFGAS